MNRMKFMLGLLFVVTLFVFAESTVWANEVHVDIINANGIEDGSIEHPFSSIQEGIDAVSENGVVLIHKGNYELNYNVDIIVNKEGITLKAEDLANLPLIYRKGTWGPAKVSPQASYLLHIKAKKAQIENLMFNVSGQYRWGILVCPNSNYNGLITIKGCVIDSYNGGGGGGIRVDGFAGSVEIYHNYMNNITFHSAVELNNSGAGKFVKIYNNIILHDYNPYTPSPVILSVDSRSIIYNNYIQGGDTSIRIYSKINPRWNYVINNIIKDFYDVAISSGKGAIPSVYPYVRVYYNDIISEWSTDLFEEIPSAWIACNFSLDPMFEYPENGDYHLKPESPCIDAGMSTPTYNDVDGSQNDIGPYGGPKGYW